MKRIAALGGGESGVGAAVLAKVKGLDIFLSDNSTISQEAKAVLEKYGIPYEEGGHSRERILNADEIIKSPGIPDTAPIVAEALNLGIPVISEIEFAGRYTKSKMALYGKNFRSSLLRRNVSFL